MPAEPIKSRRRWLKWLLWLPPVAIGITAGALPRLHTGDIRAEPVEQLRGTLMACAILYIPARLLMRGIGDAIIGELHARRERRRAAGQCAECGYDLRASPDRPGRSIRRIAP